MTTKPEERPGHRPGPRLRFADSARVYRDVLDRAFVARVPVRGRIGGARGLTATEWAALNGIVHDSVTWGFLDTDCSTYSQLADLIGKEQSLNLVRAAVKTLVGVGLVAHDVRQGQGGVPFEFVVDKSLLTPEPTPGPARGRARPERPRRPDRAKAAPEAVPPASAEDVERVHAAYAAAQAKVWDSDASEFRRSAKDEQAIARALGVLGYSADQLVQAMSGIEHVEFFTRKFRPLGLLIKDRDAVQELLSATKRRTRALRKAGGNIGVFGTDSSKSSVRDYL
jgi:hypothetical protein